MTGAARLSAELERVARLCGRRGSTLGDLAGGLSPRDHALLTLCLALCVCHPFPLLGLAVPIGLAMTVAGARMAAGLGPWIPARWASLALPGKTLERVFSAAARGALRFERAVPHGGLRGRLASRVERVNGAAIALCGVLLVLPLPPPTNFPPAFAAGLLSLAVLLESPAWLGLAYLALGLNLLAFGALAAWGWGGLKALLS